MKIFYLQIQVSKIPLNYWKNDISSTPKFVVNLERRPDRLKQIQEEMSYIGWDYELFKAVDTNSHVGCTKSHCEIIKIT